MIQQRLDRFVSDWDGKYLNYDDSVPDQCFSVANAWAKEYLSLHDFTGEYASGIIDLGGSDFTRVDKTATNSRRPARSSCSMSTRATISAWPATWTSASRRMPAVSRALTRTGLLTCTAIRLPVIIRASPDGWSRTAGLTADITVKIF
jgi:hypothetical protein